MGGILPGTDFGSNLGQNLAIRGLSPPVCYSAEQEKEGVSKVPLFEGHSLTFHHLGLIISATFGAISLLVAFFLIWRHASHYLKPYEQKYIIRILIMIPIYAVVSFFSYVYYKHAIYYEVLRDCYEAFAIASFFTLMCHYIAPNLHEQKQYFRNIEPKNWVWPVNWMQKCTGGESKGFLRKPQSGLTWFNIVWISIFQYCFIRPFFTVVAVITQANHLYCQSSKDPRYAYIWVAAFEAISVTIAMYCLIQFYIQLKTDLAPYRPFLKVLCIKLVIFFCFWQSWIISLLTTQGGPVKPSAKIAGPDWRIGLPSMLVCFEMAIFAVLHLFAFPWKPYDLGKQHDTFSSYSGEQPKGYACGPFRAIISAFNPWDIIKAFGRGMRWLFVGVRHRKNDVSYQTKLEPVSTPEYPQGPTFAGNGESATEVSRPAKASRESKLDGFEDSDTVGLLNPYANSYTRQDSYGAPHTESNIYKNPSNPDSLPTAPTPGQYLDKEYGQAPNAGFERQDTTYHGAGDEMNGTARSQRHAGAGNHEAGWDMFAGATNAPGKSSKPSGMM